MIASALLLTLLSTAPPLTAKHKKEILARLEKCNRSDGSMSDLLGGFLSDLIVAKPELLLRHVSRRSTVEQQAIGLKRLASSRDARLAKTSRMWLKVLEDVNK